MRGTRGTRDLWREDGKGKSNCRSLGCARDDTGVSSWYPGPQMRGPGHPDLWREDGKGGCESIGSAENGSMIWSDRFRFRRGAAPRSVLERLLQLAQRQFGDTLTAAEVEVLKCSTSADEPPSPEPDAVNPEGPYDPATPRPPVRAALLYWLATDGEARSCIHPKGIRAYSATIEGDLDLGEQLQLPGLDLRRCTVGDRLILEAADIKGIYITDCSVSGLLADAVVVRGPVFLHRTEFDGEIRLINAKIDNNLQLRGAKLRATDDALSLDGATVHGDLFFDQDFECSGEIRMLGAHIDGSVTFSGAHLDWDQDALTLDKVKIGGNLELNRGLRCAGTIRMPNCHIGGDLNFIGAEVRKVHCYNMDLSGDLMWHAVKSDPARLLDLTRARVKAFRDDEGSWPAEGRLRLDNFVYDDLILHDAADPQEASQGIRAAELPFKLERRIAWLMRQPDAIRLRPQPWIQLSKYLELKNNKSEAKHVLYKYRCVKANESKWWIARRAKIAFAWLEEAPARILYLIAFTLLFGTLIFTGASPEVSGGMITTARDTSQKPLSGAALDRYPRFQPFIYTLENALPLVKLGVDDKWTPDPQHKGKALFPEYPWLDWLAWFNGYWFLTMSRWVIILFGWFQAAVLGAAITSRFKP